MKPSSLPLRHPVNASGVNLFAPAEHAPPVDPGEPAVAVLVRELVLDERIQPRERMDPGKIAEYAELLRAACVEGRDPALTFKDPLVVYIDEDGTKRVSEGFHRTSSAVKEGVRELLAILRRGGIAEARLWAAGTNHAHGLPRNSTDKRRVILWFLDDASGKVTLTPEVMQRLPESARAKLVPGRPVALSDHLIADLCCVHQTTISRIRGELRAARAGASPLTDAAHQLHLSGEPERRVGADGRSRRVRQAVDAAPVPDVSAAPASAPAREGTPGASRAEAPPVPQASPQQVYLQAAELLKGWRQRVQADMAVTDGELLLLLLGEVLNCGGLGLSSSHCMVLRRMLEAPEVLLPPAEEGALWFALHKNPAPWDEIRERGADDGEVLRALQKAFGSRGAENGQQVRVEWRGGKSPEVRLYRRDAEASHWILAGQDLLNATRALLRIPSRVNRAGT